MKFLVSSIIILGLIITNTNAQTLAEYKRDRTTIEIFKTKNPIKIDGIANEPDWQIAKATTRFHQLRPFDSSFAALNTEVKILFDDQFIYVTAKCFQPKNIISISSLKRDFDGGSSDVFTVNFDTFHDRLNGFQFATNPYNVQREGLIVGEELSTFWDNKWYSETKIYDDYWQVEMAIPFKSIRYKVTDQNIWGINFARNTLKTNEVSSWSPVPRNFRPANVAYAGDLIWNSPPPNPGANISTIPYLSGRTVTEVNRGENLANANTTNASNLGFGADFKVGLGPSLNLDLTLNPDFSQVEVDQQVTNLNRFELFYPERRQFFLENSDLFGQFGFPTTRPFFSRRIGIAYNPTSGNNEPVKLLAGARLSGKINNNLRIGLLNAQTQKVDFGKNNLLPSSNYTVATVQQKVFDRSTISAIFTNKYSNLSGLSELQKAGYQQYNRVGGLEFNYFSKDNRVETETYYHQSFSPNQQKDAGIVAHYMGYHHPNIDLNFGVSRVGENYNADMGFVPRTGITSLYWPLDFKLNPKKANISKYINNYGLGFYQTEQVFDLKGKLLDSQFNPYFNFAGPAGNNLYFGYGFAYTYLFSEFDPTNTSLNPDPDKTKNIVPLPIGGYNFSNFYAGYESSQRNNLSCEIGFDKGGFFNGNFTGIDAQIQYRVQPYGVFSIGYNYTNINLPKPYNQAKYWLIGPKAEVSFSKTLFFTNYFQYNSQTNNFNINSRLQWRFKPVSDLFLVYTDNRFANPIDRYGINAFAPKNRALVFKLTYWLNV